MQQVARIDTDSFYVEPVIVTDGAELPSDLIPELPPNGMIRPRWVNSAWVDDGTPNLAGMKAGAIARLSANYRDRLNAGFVSSALGADHLYGGSSEEQADLTSAVVLGVSVPYVCTNVATGIKGQLSHTQQQLGQVMADGAAIKIGLLQQLAVKEAAINAAQTVEELNAVDLNFQ